MVCYRVLTHFCTEFQNGDSDYRRFDARLDNRPFLVFDFRVSLLWRSGLSARVIESQKLKMVG